MSGYRLPAPHGSRIDRTQRLAFTFNGRPVDAFAGDTLASAMLAQGISHIGRSFKLHRPRGIMTCGVEEPTGLLDLGRGAHRVANVRATDQLAHRGVEASSSHCWPSLEFDVGAINAHFADFLPAGFYYKTFMWPHWHWFEPAIRRMAGLGQAGNGPDPSLYDEVSASAEVLVVGAGAAGMQAALSAAQTGREVVLIEGEQEEGGWLAGQPAISGAPHPVLARLRAGLASAGVIIRRSTTALALYDGNLVVAIESLEGPGQATRVRERLWKIRARQVILATGAFERPMLFPDNDRPGAMLAGAVERYAALYGVACGRRVVIATACDSGYAVAQSLCAAGIDVAAIVDHRPTRQRGARANSPAEVPVHDASSIIAVRGTSAVRGVTIAANTGGAPRTIEADLIASCAGLTPNVNLYSQAGGKLAWNDAASMFVPQRRLDGVAVVGACAGAFDLDSALEHANATGRIAPGQPAPAAPVGGAGISRADTRPGASLAALRGKPGKQFVDFQNDVTADDIALAARENYRSVEHLKRYTTTGMATDQGKTSNINALVLMGKFTDQAPQKVGTTKFRPPYKPATLSALAGGRSGKRYRPLRSLRAHEFHRVHGALFEEFSGWERPVAYPRPGEDVTAAAARESLAVRNGVGLFDASPLGKIEIYGPDAGTFLDLMYVGNMSNLAVGSARYGALLNENGVVVDDGIVARLGPQHFLVNTTSGGAERAVLAFEEWLQCEFTSLRVLVIPQTTQWGNVTVSGPHAWHLLQRLGFDAGLSPGSMKHMSLREVEFEGKRLRILRASFNGELGYEINLPASLATNLFERLWAAGQEWQVCLYGVEALMLMRTEKGYLHIGVETDGNTLPGDVGLARGIDKKQANFVGRRSLLRPAAADPDRLQLVGLRPVDGRTMLPVGAHLALSRPPCDAEGRVTSSYHSPTLGEPVALGLLKRGRERLGERLTAWHLGATVTAEVVSPIFYDPTGARQHG